MPSDRQLVQTWEVLRVIESAPDGLTVTEIGTRLGLPPRAVTRFLRVLRDAGFPLRGVGTGAARRVVAEGGGAVPPIPLSLSNLISIYLSANLLAFLEGTPYQEGLADALTKIQATLPPETVARLDEIRRSFYAIRNPSREYARHAGILATLNVALVSRKCIRLRYRRPDWKKERQYSLAPYAIFLHKQALYVIGKVVQHGEIRIFSVTRMLGVTILRDGFAMPADFTPDRYLADAFGLIREPPRTVRVRFDKSIAAIVEETTWHPSQTIEHLPDGDLLLTLRVGGMDEVLWWVLSYGANAKVLEPPELVAAVKDTVLGMAAKYLG
jgi:proteasome accessory factor B